MYFSFYILHLLILTFRIRNQQYLNAILYADDQVFIQENEDGKMTFSLLDMLISEYNMKMLIVKTKMITFRGKVLVRLKKL